MKNQNDEEIIIDKELLSLIEYAKWELSNFNLLKKSPKITKSELILIDKDLLKNWKEKSGYNIFKKYIFNHLFTLNKLKNNKDKINQEKDDINQKWKKLVSDNIIDPNNIKSLSITDMSGLYFTLKEKKINGYNNYQIISSKLYNTFKNFMNYKISVQGFYHKGKLIIPINYSNEFNLRTSLKSGENFLEIIYLNDKNELEDILCILPNDNSICKEIEEYFLNENIDDLIKNVFSHIDIKDNIYISDFVDNFGNKHEYKIINKKYKENSIEKNNKENELEKLKLVLSEKMKKLQNVNKQINQRNNNIMKLKSKLNDKNIKINEGKNNKLEEIKKIFLENKKEYENKQKELDSIKQNVISKEKLLNNLKLKEEQSGKKIKILENKGIKSNIKQNNNSNNLLQEKKTKEKEEFLNNKEKELNIREQNIIKKELEINDEKLDILKKEEELDNKLKEINDKLIMMKNKTYLMNFKEKEENVIYKNKNSNSIEELEAEFEPATCGLNSNRNIKPVIKIKNIEIKKNLFNKSKTININNFTNHKNNYSPDYNKYKRKSNLIVENRNNTIQNDNINFDRRSLQFNIKRIQTFKNNIFSPIKTQTTQIKRNPKVNQTETKLNIKYPSLGLEQTDYPKNINAVLQCLSHILELAEGILELGYKEKYFKENQNVELSRNFASVVNNIFFPLKYNNTSKIYSPQNFVDTFIQMCPLINKEKLPIYFSEYEMVKFILDTMHNELNKKKLDNIKENDDLNNEEKIDLTNEKKVLVNFLTKLTNNNNSLISKLFYGLTKVKYVCNECGNNKFNFDHYSFLYFDLKKIKKYYINNKLRISKKYGALTIYDCLDYYMRPINLPSLYQEINTNILKIFGINIKTGKAFCDNCQIDTKCKIYNYLYSANTILPIILERGDDDNYFIEDINIPDELNLENYVEFKKSIKKYYLCGVVINLGKNNTYGKFVTFCRMSYNNKWHCYNNEKINSCQLKDVFKQGIPHMIIYHKI